jgi:hypothetical protein
VKKRGKGEGSLAGGGIWRRGVEIKGVKGKGLRKRAIKIAYCRGRTRKSGIGYGRGREEGERK